MAVENPYSNHFCRGKIVCPYCGHVHEEDCEWISPTDGEEDVLECEECGKEFLCGVSVDIHYATYGKRANGSWDVWDEGYEVKENKQC